MTQDHDDSCHGKDPYCPRRTMPRETAFWATAPSPPDAPPRPPMSKDDSLATQDHAAAVNCVRDRAEYMRESRAEYMRESFGMSGYDYIIKRAEAFEYVAAMADAALKLEAALREAVALRESLLRNSDGSLKDDPGLCHWIRALGAIEQARKATAAPLDSAAPAEAPPELG